MNVLGDMAFVIGTLTIFILATIGMVVVGIASYLGSMVVIHQLEKVDQADELIRLQMEKEQLERMAQSA